jgi:hypothetical protein
MGSRTPLVIGGHIASVLWFPFLFAIALPVIFELAFHAPQPHRVPIAVVGSARQVEVLGEDLHSVSSGGFTVEQLPTKATAIGSVRDRRVAAAYVASPSNASVYVARAASAVRASYLQGVFTQIAVQAGTPPPQLVDVVPLRPGDSGNGTFFFVFPMLMVGVITVLVLLQRASTWSIERRMLAVLAMGTVGATTAFITVVSLNVLPDKLALLFYALFLSQVFGQLLLGAAHLLRQFFLPVSLTFALVLSVPSAGGTVPPDLLPTWLRYLSDVLPLAQGVKITRSVAYFGGASILAPTMILVAWATLGAVVVGVARYRSQAARTPPEVAVVTVDSDSRAETTAVDQ